MHVLASVGGLRSRGALSRTGVLRNETPRRFALMGHHSRLQQRFSWPTAARPDIHPALNSNRDCEVFRAPGEAELWKSACFPSDLHPIYVRPVRWAL